VEDVDGEAQDPLRLLGIAADGGAGRSRRLPGVTALRPGRSWLPGPTRSDREAEDPVGLLLLIAHPSHVR
jgi:hypothetical protein